MASQRLLSLVFLSAVYFVAWFNCIQGGPRDPRIHIPCVKEEGIARILEEIDLLCDCNLEDKLVTHDVEHVLQHIAKLGSDEPAKCNKTKQLEEICKRIPAIVRNCIFSYSDETKTYSLESCF